MGWEIPGFSEKEKKRRHEKIRELMKSRGIACLIICGHPGNYRSAAADLRYVSNYCMWFDDEYVVFPLEGEPTLIVWSPGHGAWAEMVSWIPVQTSSRSKEGREYAKDIAKRIQELGLQKATLGIVNMRTMPAYTYVGLKEQLPQAQFVPAGDIIRECRLVKSAEELEFFRKSGECADKAVQAILKATKPGVKEADLAAECESAMVKAGAELGSFILIASGPWTEMGNGIPFGGSERTLKKGDIILNEITANYGGCYTQICWPISIGNQPDDFWKLYQLHQEMYELARQETRAGNSVAAIEAKVTQLASQKGEFSAAWCLQTAELSDTAIGYQGELKAGMVFVNHPFTLPPRGKKGYGGHIFGNTFIVKDGEPECVSKLPVQVNVV